MIQDVIDYMEVDLAKIRPANRSLMVRPSQRSLANSQRKKPSLDQGRKPGSLEGRIGNIFAIKELPS